MKKFIYSSLFIVIVIAAKAQQNYIHTYSLQTAGYTNAANINPVIPAADVAESYEYIDGLGRVNQTVLRRASVAGTDIVLPKLLDAFGRDVTNYLPYVSSNSSGGYDNNFQNNVQSYYQNQPGIAHTLYPASPVEYEKSPESRLLRSGFPGENGQAGSVNQVQYSYGTNMASDPKFGSVAQWLFDPATLTCTRSTDFNASELFVQSITDEDGNTTLQFTG